MDDFSVQLEKANRLNLITQHIGFALWQIQELESVTAQYFVLLVQAERGMGLAVGTALDKKAKEKTFGANIRRITEAGLLSAELENRFRHLLSERNWLVHKSRDDNRSAIHYDSDMKKLIVRIDKMAEESTSLLKKIGTLCEAHAIKHGVTKEYIDKKAKELLDQWHTSDEF